MYNNENPTQGIHAQCHEARLVGGIRIVDGDGPLIVKRLLRMREAHAMLAKVGLRLVRVEFMTMRERDFVLACRSIGMSDIRIIFRQILPNTLSPVIVTASIMVASAILTESSLAFLGLGDPNVMSWGTMIGAGRDQLRTAWYLTAIPGVAILLTVLAINLIGEGLNDAFNPKLRNR